jgi:hypothetical protein
VSVSLNLNTIIVGLLLQIHRSMMTIISKEDTSEEGAAIINSDVRSDESEEGMIDPLSTNLLALSKMTYPVSSFFPPEAL